MSIGPDRAMRVPPLADTTGLPTIP